MAPIRAWSSHFVKRALLHRARDLAGRAAPADARGLGAAGARPRRQGASTSPSATPSAPAFRSGADEFVNTWSIDGFCRRGLQPAELGWGTHERHLPPDGARHAFGCGAAIYLSRPGACTRVRSWTPLEGPYHGFLITHNESISHRGLSHAARRTIASLYRPTCHYAYHPCDDAVLSLHELHGNDVPPADAHASDERRDRRRHRRTRRAAVSAMPRAPIGTARSCRSTRRAGWRRTRTPPACR